MAAVKANLDLMEAAQSQAVEVVQAQIEKAKTVATQLVTDASEVMKSTANEAKRAAAKVAAVAKENPLVAAGIFVGIGVLLGALLHRTLRPTAAQILLGAVKRSTSAS